VLQIAVFLLGILINRAIYTSDRFYKTFTRVAPPLLSVAAGFLIMIILSGFAIFVLANSPIFELYIALPYLAVTTVPLAINRRRKLEPEKKNILSIVLIALALIVIIFDVMGSISKSLSIAKIKSADNYTVLDNPNYLPAGYKIYSKDYYDGGIVISLECLSKDEWEDDFSSDFVIINEYIPGSTYDARNHGPRPSHLPDSDRYEVREVEIRGKLAKLEEGTRYYEGVVERIDNRLVWEEGGLVIDITGDFENEDYDDYEGIIPSKCSVTGEELIKVAESLGSS